MQASKIEWTDRTWNPVTGCTKISQGCKNCYAEKMHERWNGKGSFRNVQERHERLDQPLKWKKPSKIFVNSMSDLFHEDVSFLFIDKVFDVIDASLKHTFQILTKRADRMLEFYKWKEEGNGLRFDTWPLPNLWIGVSVEDQKTADERIQLLMDIPAAVRFLSCEPLLGPVNIHQSVRLHQFDILRSFHSTYFGNEIHWVIAGGESGHGARPMHPDWVRSIRDQCKAAMVPFFFKQWGEYIPFEKDAQPPSGKWMSGRWMDGLEAMIYCDELQSSECMFLRLGKSKTGNKIDGVQHQNFPHAVGTTPS